MQHNVDYVVKSKTMSVSKSDVCYRNNKGITERFVILRILYIDTINEEVICMKRTMSVITAILLSFCIIIAPITTVEAVGETSGTESGGGSSASTENEFSANGTNSFGNLLSDEITEKEDELRENAGNNVLAVEIRDNNAYVDFETTEDGSVVVGIYDEAGVQMVTSASAEVSAGQTEVVIPLDGEKIPDYFYIKAFLVDSNTLRPMCTVYESPNYTQEMQEFFAKTTDDFEEDRVLNLDDDKTNNFAVYSDNTKIINETEEHNQVISVDDENLTYVIGNIDDSITNLRSGDVFAQNYGDDNVLIVKVASVTIDGTTATIIGQNTDMDEVFDYIKIDTVSDIGDAEIDTDEMDEDVTYEGMSGVNTTSSSSGYNPMLAASALGYTFEATGEYKTLFYKFEKEFYNNSNDPLDNGNVDPISVTGKVKGSVELSMKLTFKLYLTLKEQYIEVKFDYKLAAEVNASLSADFKLQIGKLSYTPVPGVYINLRPSLVLKISGKISIKATAKGMIGAKLSVQTGAEKIENKPSVEIMGEAEATIFIGISLEPSVSIFSENVAKASMTAEIGVELKAVLKTGVTFAEERHSCTACISGDVNGKIKLEMSVTFLKKHELKLTPFDITIPIGECYYSIDHREFGWGKCPYKEYRCTVTVTDSNGDVVSGAVINDNYTTKSDGKVSFYLKPESVTLTAKKDNVTGSYTGNIDAPKSIIIKLGSSQGTATNTGGSGSGTSSGGSSLSGGGNWSDTGNVYWVGNDSDFHDTEWKDVKIGGGHVGAIDKNGDLYMWGQDNYGQVGCGGETASYITSPKKILSNVRYINLRNSSSAAITNDDVLYLWGNNSYGQIGDSTTKLKTSPVRIMDNVKTVFLSGASTFIVTNDSELYVCGSNDCGQLGDGTTTSRTSPVKIMSGVETVCSNVNGTSSVAAILKNGDLYTWGNNTYGQLGIGNLGLSGTRLIPTKIMENVSYAVMGNHSAAITKSGDLYMWGQNNYGQLGIGNNTDISYPVKVSEGVKHVVISNNCASAYITNSGELYTFGNGGNYMLGNQGYTNKYTPQKIFDNIKKVDLIGSMGFAISYNGAMYTWGYATYGPICTGSTQATKPTLVFANAENAFTNGQTSAIITYDNGIVNSSLYMCGYGGSGELGDGRTGSYNCTPVKVSINYTTSSSASIRTTNQLTKVYDDLEAEETYNFYVLKDTNAENLLASENVYYISQGQADSDGRLSFTYAPTEDYESAYRFVVAQHRKDLAYATVSAEEMIYNTEEQFVKPTVRLDGVYLVEGVDYELTGDYCAKEAGEHTVIIKGIGKYVGSVSYTYRIILDYVNLSSIDNQQIYLGDTITINANAAGGQGDYTYSYYFRNIEEQYWYPLKLSTTETTFEFEPEEIGTFYARVDATDSTGEVRRKAIIYIVEPKYLTNRSSISATSVKTGTVVTLYGDALGGSQPYSYAYYMKDIFSDTWDTVKEYSTSNKCNVTMSKVGNYDICIKVKDQNGTVVKRYFIIEVTAKKLTAQEIEKGQKTEAVEATCTKDGNIEYYLTDGKYYQFKDGNYTEISSSETIIHKTGHNYVCSEDEPPTFKGHTMVCTKCGDVITGEHIYDENDVCIECGYEKENIVLKDWSKATYEFTDGSNGLYAYTKRMIAPEFTITYEGNVLEEYEDFDFTEESETESKRAGKHTIIICDKNDETNTFSFDYYIYSLNMTLEETANTTNKIKFIATRNDDKTNITAFGMVFDRNGSIGENVSVTNYTNNSKTTKKTTSKYSVNVVDSGNGVWGKPYMTVDLNDESYTVYGTPKYDTRFTEEQIAVPVIQDIEPELVNGKASVKVQKPVYDANRYVCKEMGVLFSKNGTIDSIDAARTNDTLVYANVGNGVVSKGFVNGAKINADNLDNYSSYSANISFSNGNPVYTRAYVIMTSKETNEDVVIYGNYYVTTL